MANAFSTAELESQLAYFERNHADRELYRGIPHRLARRAENLNPIIRNVANAYFVENDITWHTHANHALSSQACCLNFLMPLAHDPMRLSAVIGAALGFSNLKMLPVETAADAQPWYVAFECVGLEDYFGEGMEGKLKRGANCTSADAKVAFEVDGRKEIALIEWKYTESYGAPLRDGSHDGRGGHITRRSRYSHLMFAPTGPLEPRNLSLDAFFYEPFYQLLRQQMLACQMELHKEADIVRVLHISPRTNERLHRVTSPALAGSEMDAFRLFRSLLTKPDRLVVRTTDEVFGDALRAASSQDRWASYLTARYGNITATPNAVA